MQVHDLLVAQEFFHQRPVDEILSFGEFGNPAQAAFDGRCGVVDVVAVEAEAFFQTQRIAGPEADVLQPVLPAGLPERLPEFVAVLVGRIDLAAARSGICLLYTSPSPRDA